MQDRRRPDKDKVGLCFIEHSLGVNEVARDPVLSARVLPVCLDHVREWPRLCTGFARAPPESTRFLAVPVAAMIAMRMSFMNALQQNFLSG